MTVYTETKRALQHLGFKVVNRFGDRDVILENGGTKIRIAANCYGHDLMYVASENGLPVSWHYASRRCSQPGKWTGFNGNIEVTSEEEMNARERELFCAMYNIAHFGHHTAAIEKADIFEV